MALIECVPNISEGRRPEVIQAIVEAVKATPGVGWLDLSTDPDHNRSVLTYAGEAPALLEAAMRLFAEALKHIDLRQHQGGHPRMGAVDVMPFIPLTGATMADCVALAREVGEEISRRFGVPVSLYEEAASAPHRKNLADLRRGEFEGLGAKLAEAQWKPDFGPAAPHESGGCTAVGARMPLIAYNVYLQSDRLEVAQAIAKAVRGSSGGLAFVKGMGLLIPEHDNQAQVSMNLVNYQKTPIYRVVEMIKSEARRYGVEVASSEIVGLVPQEALLESGAYYREVEGRPTPDSTAQALDEAAAYLQVERWSQDLVLERRLLSIQGATA